MMEMTIGILIPFIGTSLGTFCVFFMKNDMSRQVQRALTGFAAGEHSNIGVILFSLGFTVMMILDVALG